METNDRSRREPVARPAPPRGRKKRHHAAARSRLIAGAMSVTAFLGLGSGMAIGAAQTASSAASAPTTSSASSTSTGSSSSSTWAASPAQSTTSQTPVSVSHGS